MPIIFTREDAQVCSRCNQNKPSFRLIALAVIDPTESSSLKTMAILVCTACLKLELDEFHQSLGQTKEPIEEWETKEMFFCQQIGILAVPLVLAPDGAQFLINELETDGLELTVN